MTRDYSLTSLPLETPNKSGTERSMSERYVAYYRVSTKRQGQSGLGLEAQKKAVADYFGTRQHHLVHQYVETESGTRNDRPQLTAALEACRLHQARLVIAKLDRLARNAAFLLNLRDAGVDFVCCDMPDANRLTVGILAMVAEDEADRISQRAKAALAAAKARGVQLGTAGPKNLKNQLQGSKRGNQVRAAKADQNALALSKIVLPLRQQKLSLRAIAAHLNEASIPTAPGGTWKAPQVRRLLDRLDRIAS